MPLLGLLSQQGIKKSIRNGPPQQNNADPVPQQKIFSEL